MAVPAVQRKFARRLLELRTAQGISQQTLAERAELSVDGVAKLEQGHFSPTLRTLSLLAQGLNVTVSELTDFGGARGNAHLTALVGLLRGRPEREVALVLRLARAALVEKD